MLFNEYYHLCEKNGWEFTHIRDMMLQNGWIDWHHTFVPGPDGRLGFGGACFPKDTSALNEFIKRNNTPGSVLNAVVKENKEIRPQ